MKKNEYSIASHGYNDFQKSIQVEFKKSIKNGKPLFKVDTFEDLWTIYLDSIEPIGRQQYNCSCCKSFIRNFGGLVTMDDAGNLHSAIWHPDFAPEYFKEAASQLKKIVEASPIKTVFCADQTQLGTCKAGGRSHLFVELPKRYINCSTLKTAKQIMAEKIEEIKMLSTSLEEYTTESISTVKAIILSDTLYRSERFIGIISWFSEAQERISRETSEELTERLKWYYVAVAEKGFCHIKNSMVGTLLDDYQKGVSSEELVQRYNNKMDPSRYMRSQVAPTETGIMEAEKIVEKLGIANSLERRYAKFEEIPEFIWRSSNRNAQVNKKASKGIFSEIIPKIKKTKTNQLNLPKSTMTWKKFAEKILPEATTIEARVDETSRLMALVTENVPNSTAILQWDNPFTWYYHGGVDGEIKRRVQAAGGRYEENDIRCSLIWENRTDLDLHCLTPKGKHIFFNQKRETNGWLDVDMNVQGETMYPIENIRWSKGEGVNGSYTFYVHNYNDRSNGNGNPFKVELEVAGQVYVYQGNLRATGMKEIVFEFKYRDGQLIRMISASNSCKNDDWNVEEGSFVSVTGITTSPNLWGDNPVKHSGNHTFFILDGCRDKSQGKGRGFFNEMLNSELKEIRKTLEAYTASALIQDADEASACGLGFSKEAEWDLVLKVRVNGLERLIKIDRFD